jgi:hypothetical protein
MTPEEQLADLVETFLSHGQKLDPFMGAVMFGVSQIGDACVDAQKKSGNWGSMLAKLRSGAEAIELAIEHLHGKSGLERFVAFAERYRLFAREMINEIVRLQADESTHVRRVGIPFAAFAVGDVYIDYAHEDAKFRYDKTTGKVYRRFHGGAEDEIPPSSELYHQAIQGGREITRDEYYAD